MFNGDADGQFDRCDDAVAQFEWYNEPPASTAASVLAINTEVAVSTLPPTVGTTIPPKPRLIWASEPAPGNSDSALPSHEFTTDDIPPLAGPQDPRDPIQRYLGVPADVDAAARWEFAHMERAVAECMTAAGFAYRERSFDAQDAPDPQASSPAYAAALNGFGPNDGQGCTTTASNRVHALNAIPGALAEISNAVNSNPAVQEALAATAACLTSAGYDPQSPPPPAVASSCNQGQSVINSVRESVELTVMNEHYDFFVAFKAHLPDV